MITVKFRYLAMGSSLSKGGGLIIGASYERRDA